MIIHIVMKSEMQIIAFLEIAIPTAFLALEKKKQLVSSTLQALSI